MAAVTASARLGWKQTDPDSSLGHEKEGLKWKRRRFKGGKASKAPYFGHLAQEERCRAL